MHNKYNYFYNFKTIIVIKPILLYRYYNYPSGFIGTYNDQIGNLSLEFRFIHTHYINIFKNLSLTVHNKMVVLIWKKNCIVTAAHRTSLKLRIKSKYSYLTIPQNAIIWINSYYKMKNFREHAHCDDECASCSISFTYDINTTTIII